MKKKQFHEHTTYPGKNEDDNESNLQKKNGVFHFLFNSLHIEIPRCEICHR